jgi:hypothetical protein
MVWGEDKVVAAVAKVALVAVDAELAVFAVKAAVAVLAFPLRSPTKFVALMELNPDMLE